MSITRIQESLERWSTNSGVLLLALIVLTFVTECWVAAGLKLAHGVRYYPQDLEFSRMAKQSKASRDGDGHWVRGICHLAARFDSRARLPMCWTALCVGHGFLHALSTYTLHASPSEAAWCKTRVLCRGDFYATSHAWENLLC